MPDDRAPATGPLAELASAYGVDPGYDGFDGRWRPAPAATIRTALAAFGVEVADDDAARAALEQAELAPWRSLVPPSTVVPATRRASVDLRLPDDGRPVAASLATEDGAIIELPAPSRRNGLTSRTVDGLPRVKAQLALPDGLPQGYHRLTVHAGETSVSGTVIVTPGRCPLPDGLPRSWGWMLQLYALRSRQSWGVGELADLRRLLAETAGDGAQFAVINPLHAQAPVTPVEPSPYYPSSRRFHDPLYLRVDEVPEVAGLGPSSRSELARLAANARATADRIDRDAVLRCKLAALERAFDAMGDRRREALERFWSTRGQALTAFATFCAIAETYGVPFQDWPAGLRHPASRAVAAFRRDHADRVRFHAWLQMLCAEQLATCQQGAREAGMQLGVVGDLAVGVHHGGADAWALQDELGQGVTVGAPPDAFNQRGQDWAQPPLLPDRLHQTGYAPFREILRAVLEHAGGLRIDHVMGLFRLFWIPAGETAEAGTYVRYPAEEMLGVLALEAQRAGAIVVGEDLGTVEHGVRDTLAEHRVLGSAVLYFERTGHDGRPKRPDQYPAQALASISTHDLPTAAGWWRGEDVRLRVELGLLGEDSTPADEWARKDADRRALRDLLIAEGLAGDGADLSDLVVAMHALLARTPSRLVAAAVGDAVGDLRQPNLPGTVSAYPNWRLPLARPEGDGHRPVSLEEALAEPLLRRVVTALAAQRPSHRSDGRD